MEFFCYSDYSGPFVKREWTWRICGKSCCFKNYALLEGDAILSRMDFQNVILKLHMQHSFWNDMDFPTQNDANNWLRRVNNSFILNKWNSSFRERPGSLGNNKQGRPHLFNMNTICVKKLQFVFAGTWLLEKDTLLYCLVVAYLKQHSHLTWFWRNIASMHWILHFLTWFPHIKKWL